MIFIPISIRYRTNRAETVFQALAARLAELADGAPLQQPLADPAGYYMDLARDILDELEASAEAPIALILDGLDEGVGFEGYAGIFPSRKLQGVKLVVSARLTAQAPDEEAWKRNLDWDQPTDRVAAHFVPSLSREGLEDVLLRMGFPLADLAKDTDIVATLLHLTEGDPLLVGLYVEDLRKKGEEAAHLTPKELEALEPGFAGYFKKWFGDQRQLWGDQDPLRERETVGVLAVLACALGSLRAAEIERILMTMGQPLEIPVHRLVEPVQRFVIGRPDTDGYALSHPKLGEFLLSPDNGVIVSTTVTRTTQALLGWGRNSVKQFEALPPTPEQAPKYEYLLSYYASHLLRENAPVEDFLALVENGWRQA